VRKLFSGREVGGVLRARLPQTLPRAERTAHRAKGAGWKDPVFFQRLNACGDDRKLRVCKGPAPPMTTILLLFVLGIVLLFFDLFLPGIILSVAGTLGETKPIDVSF